MTEKKSFVTRLDVVTHKLLRLALELPEFKDQSLQEIVDGAIRDRVEPIVKTYYTPEALDRILEAEK